MGKESALKRKCREWIEGEYGGRLVHVSPKGVNGYPDSDLLIPGCHLVKVEFKAPGKILSPEQRREGQWLLEHGFQYWTVWDFETFKECVYALRWHRNDATTTAAS